MVIGAVRKLLVENFSETEAKMNKEFSKLSKWFA